MPNEYQQALEDLKIKQFNYGLASEAYESVAYHEMKAAEERVNAIIRDLKGGAKDESSGL